MNWNPDLMPYPQMNSKWVVGSHERGESMKLPGGNPDGNQAEFLDLTPKHHPEEGAVSRPAVKRSISANDATKDTKRTVVWEGQAHTQPTESTPNSAH